MIVTADYQLRFSEDEYAVRVAAVDVNNREIVGAYRPLSLNHWMLYVTKAFIGETDDLPQPNKVHVVSRQDAIKWLNVLASFYMKAVSQ